MYRQKMDFSSCAYVGVYVDGWFSNIVTHFLISTTSNCPGLTVSTYRVTLVFCLACRLILLLICTLMRWLVHFVEDSLHKQSGDCNGFTDTTISYTVKSCICIVES